MTYLFLAIGFALLIGGINLMTENSHVLFRALSGNSSRGEYIFRICFPIIVSAFTAAIYGNDEMVFGIILGSDIFFILVVCGVCSMLQTIPVKRNVCLRELPFSIFSEVILLFLAADYLLHGKHTVNQISRWDGVLLIVIFLLFCASYFFKNIEKNVNEKTIHMGRNVRKSGLAAKQHSSIVGANIIENLKRNWADMKWNAKNIVFFLVGLILFIPSVICVIYCSFQIASLLKISQYLMGMTFVSIVISISGLIPLISATMKNEKNNVIIESLTTAGIVNLLFTLGVAAVIRPIAISFHNIQDIIFLYICSLILWIILYRNQKLNRLIGCGFVSLYIIYMFYLCIR